MADATHLGQTASNLVSLERHNTHQQPVPFSFLRRLPNFRMEPSSGYPGYSPPEGQVLIVTDVNWEYGDGQPGQGASILITLESLLDQPVGEGWRPRESAPVFVSTLTLDARGYGAQNVAMTTGFVVPHGVRIEAKHGGPGLASFGDLLDVLLRGYLAPDK